MRRGRAITTVAVALAVCAWTSRVAAQNPAVETSRAVVEIGVADVFNFISPAFRRGGDVLLPLAPVIDSLGIVVRDTRRGPLFRSPRGHDVLVDTIAGTIRDGENRLVVSRADIVNGGDGLYLAHPLLARLLGVQIGVDWVASRVTINDAATLPAVRWLSDARARSSRWRRLGLVEAPMIGPALPLARPALDGAFVDYVVSAPFTAPKTTGLYTVSAGLNVGGGALNVISGGGFATPGPTQVSWLGVWRESRWLTQLRLGDAVTTGPRGRSVRGFSVTNAPYLRPLTFDQFSFPVGMPAGWELETSYNGVPVRVDTVPADGRVLVPIPIRFGGNLVTFTAYGPRGEERRIDRLVQLSASEVLPAGRLEYGVSGGECRAATCQSQGNLDLRYGITPRLTIRAGTDGVVRADGSMWGLPYGAISAQPTNALFVSGGGVAGTSSLLTGRWQPDLDRNVLMEWGRGRTTLDAQQIGAAGADSRFSAFGFLRPSWLPLGVFGSLAFNSTSLNALTSRRTTLSLGLPFAGTQLSPYVARDQALSGALTTSAQTAYGVRFTIVPPRTEQSWLQAGSAFGAIEVGGLQGRSVSATWLQPLVRGIRADVGVTASSLYRGPQGTVRIYTDLPAFRSVTTMVAGQGPVPGGNQFFQGSVLGDRAAREIALAPGPTIERAGVTGRVFLDANVNGQFDDGDEPLGGVVVRVGTTSTVTRKDGRFRVWDVLAFEPVEIEVDKSSLESPLWVMPTTRLVIRPGPNRFERFDVPVIPGGAVRGMATAPWEDSLPTPLAGARIVLRAVRGGLTTTVPSFSDGSFQALGVAPGDYVAYFDSATVRQLRIISDTTAFTVRSVENGDRINDLVVTAHKPPEPPPPLPAIRPLPPVQRALDRLKHRAAFIWPVPPTTVVDDGFSLLEVENPRALLAGGGVRVTLRGVNFIARSAELSSASFAALDAVVATLREAPELRIEVAGFTDDQGKRKANLTLSGARAAVVKYYLVRQGIADRRVVVRGYGPDTPVASNDTKEGRAMNRRVELRRIEAGGNP
jgi:outer membrane protein OmpA-like peptidoglycan-associated protein